MSTIEQSKNLSAAVRVRQRFEEKYGDMSDVVRAINAWQRTVEDYNRACNRDMERPVTDQDVDAAESAMLHAIRQYAGKA
jgi:hypothetical protein